MRKLDEIERNALNFLASCGEFSLPEHPRASAKSQAIANVMDSLVKRRLALLVDTSEDGIPRYAITYAGRDHASQFQ